MTLLGTFVLAAGVIDDLRSQKVHNYLILILFLITFVTVLVVSGVAGLATGALSFLLALFFGMPLFFAKMLGAGDVKLFAVFGLATDFNAVLHVAVLSILWGALLGVVKAIFSGQLQTLILSTTQMLWTKGEGAKQFRIPFTVAMFFGWMTHLSLIRMGVSIW